MVRANSLLYALYVCLIVALLCGALLYMANLYNQLNIYYVTKGELYIHNQSLVNYALAHPEGNTIAEEDRDSLASHYHMKPHGLLMLLTAKSIAHNDTITSVHFAGAGSSDKTCLYVTNFRKGLNYSGTVRLIGDKKLPADYLRPIHIDNKPNVLEQKGKMELSGATLPEPGKMVKEAFKGFAATPLTINDALKGGAFHNSFLRPTVELQLENPVLGSVAIRGNVIITAPDSIVVSSSAILEDVLLAAPKIYLAAGFKGSVQVFASEKIEVGDNAELLYPSVLYVNNTASNKGYIHIKEKSRIYGAIVLYGNAVEQMQKSRIEIDTDVKIVGDIYCAAHLILKSDVYGSVYTNRLIYTTSSSGYDDCIADVEINPGKKPGPFISIPLFDGNKKYEALKKLL